MCMRASACLPVFPENCRLVPLEYLTHISCPFVLQEMDAVDYYPRIHKSFMGELKFRGCGIQCVTILHPGCYQVKK